MTAHNVNDNKKKFVEVNSTPDLGFDPGDNYLSWLGRCPVVLESNHHLGLNMTIDLDCQTLCDVFADLLRLV
jgi:hypothetical protein